MSGCVMMVFAAKVETCAEKHKSCTEACANAKSQARARQADQAQYENAYKMCIQDCDKKKTECDDKTKKP